jgi:hypothetical protein
VVSDLIVNTRTEIDQAFRDHRSGTFGAVPYVAKAERKGRTNAEVVEILRWQTGYDQHDVRSPTWSAVRVEYVEEPPWNR